MRCPTVLLCTSLNWEEHFFERCREKARAAACPGHAPRDRRDNLDLRRGIPDTPSIVRRNTADPVQAPHQLRGTLCAFQLLAGRVPLSFASGVAPDWRSGRIEFAILGRPLCGLLISHPFSLCAEKVEPWLAPDAGGSCDQVGEAEKLKRSALPPA